MTVRIDVVATIPDARAQVKIKQFQALAGRERVGKVHIADSYLIDAALTPGELTLARRALTNSRVEASYMGRWLPAKFHWGIEIGFLSGVTDNVGATAKETIEDATKKKFKDGEQVYSAQVFFIEGNLSRTHIEKITASLHNSLIQSAKIFGTDLRKEARAIPSVPRVSLLPARQSLGAGGGSSRVLSVNLEVSDGELIEIGGEGIANEHGIHRDPLALNFDSMVSIRNHFRHEGRSPTDAELEMLAQTWSEHCKHTIFASAIDGIKDGLYKTYIQGATEKIRNAKRKTRNGDICISVFKDNAFSKAHRRGRDSRHQCGRKSERHSNPERLHAF